MSTFLSLYFFMIAAVQLGLFFGVCHYYRSQNLVKASQYWLSSLLISALAFFIFGFGLLGVEDISRPAPIFIIANSLIYLGTLLQTIFCISLNGDVSKRLKVICGISFLIFVACFEFLRLTSTFELRTSFIVSIASVFYCIQIFQIGKFRIQDQSKQLLYLQVVTTLELICAISRLVILLITSIGIKSLEQIPQMLILFTLTQLVMNTLSYIAITGYKAEKVSYAKAKSDAEKEASEQKLIEISELLKEKERLIYGLMKANKTASTGALSASIAHELNQPLGASNLNIQLLKMKLEKGTLNPELIKEILDDLERDNDRAATVVKSLRSIFIDRNSRVEEVQLGDLISKVLDIVKSELKSKNIQIQLKVDDSLIIKVNSAEIKQVILNLINNAVHALANSGTLQRRITIVAYKEGQLVHLSIADNGPGVSLEFKPQLFELLSTTNQAGMGLGLWLCKHIITRYSGAIDYEDAIGGGAKFVIQIPSVA